MESTTAKTSNIELITNAQGAIEAALKDTHDITEEAALRDILDRIKKVQDTAARAQLKPVDASGRVDGGHQVAGQQLAEPDVSVRFGSDGRVTYITRELDEFEFPHRRLGYDLAPGNMVDQPDGGLLVRDVPLLASGTWTDSAQRTALFYPSSTLERYAKNWRDMGIWSRHTGGVPRSISEKIGTVQNPRYQDGAVVGDLLLHGATSASRDAIALVKGGHINYVSVEHSGDEKYNTATGRREAASLEFHGLALVNRGACEKCRIRGNEAAMVVVAELAEPEVQVFREGSEIDGFLTYAVYSEEGLRALAGDSSVRGLEEPDVHVIHELGTVYAADDLGPEGA